MRFKDERPLWYSEVEGLASELEGKSKQELVEILEYNDIIAIREGDRPKVTALGRVLLLLVFPSLLLLGCIKWVTTGDFYLDSWLKKVKWLGKVADYVGIK